MECNCENKNEKTDSKIGGKNWMSHLSDDLKLSQITIPGTHDSCAFECSQFAKCQQLSLADQLNSGVRYIDIRCCHRNDVFELYHSSFNLGDVFDSGVIEPCVNFLRNNPSETLLMLVSPEHKAQNNRIEFDDLFLKYIEPFKMFWHFDEEEIPSLGRVRGKIVLLRRFWSAKPIPFGIDMSGWKHNDTFRIQNRPNIEFFVQDEYKLMAKEKWQKVKEVMEEAMSSRFDASKTWCLNYCSAQNWPIQPPRYIAWALNRSLKEHLSWLNSDSNVNKRIGVLVMDFTSKDLIENVLMLNFK